MVDVNHWYAAVLAAVAAFAVNVWVANSTFRDLDDDANYPDSI